MNTKKVLTSMLAGGMAFASFAGPAFAAPRAETTATIDQTKDIKLTIHKLIENDGLNVEADGLVNEAENRMPVDNIEFTYWRIADIVSVSGKNAAGKTVSGAYFHNLNADFLGALKDDAGEPIPVTPADIIVNGDTDDKYYTTEAIEAAMKQALACAGEVDLNAIVKAKGTPMTRTDATGTTTKTFSGPSEGAVNPNQGLYLIAETDISYHDGAAGDVDHKTAQWVDTVTGRIHDDRADRSHDPSNGGATHSQDDNGVWTHTSNGGGDNAENTQTWHHYNYGELYQESQNPEAPIVSQIASPFLVALPTTNTAVVSDENDNEYEPGTVWQYDVDVYPKNQTTQVAKRIIDPDEKDAEETLRTHEDYQVGDKIEQIIWADVAALQQNYLNWSDNDVENEGEDGLSDEQDFDISDKKNLHTAYMITDTMSDSWTFDAVTKVALVKKPSDIYGQNTNEDANNDGKPDQADKQYSGMPSKITDWTLEADTDGFNEQSIYQVLDPETDYTVEKGKNADQVLGNDTSDAEAGDRDSDGFHTFTVKLTDAGLAKINASPYAATMYKVRVDNRDENGTATAVTLLNEKGETVSDAREIAAVLEVAGKDSLLAAAGQSILVPGREVQLMVFFDSTLNRNAVIGETFENQNYPTLTYGTSSMGYEDQNREIPKTNKVNGNEIYSYTYELDVTKAGLDDASQARFIIGRTDLMAPVSLTDEAGETVAIAPDLAQDASKDLSNYVNSTNALGVPKASQEAVQEDGVRWVKEADGVYHVYDYAQANSNIGGSDGAAVTDARVAGAQHGDNKDDDNAAKARTAVSEVGKIEVSDINGKKYYTVTPDKDGKLILKGFDSNKYTFKEVRTEDESNLLKSTFDVIFTAADPARDGRFATATVTMGDVTTNLDIDEENGGKASMIVNNYDAVDLRTGGRGRMMIYATAIGMAAALGVVAVATRKKEEE